MGWVNPTAINTGGMVGFTHTTDPIARRVYVTRRMIQPPWTSPRQARA